MPAKPRWKFQPWWEAAASLTDNDKFTVGSLLVWPLRWSVFSLERPGLERQRDASCFPVVGAWAEVDGGCVGCVCIPQPFAARNGASAPSLRELLYPALVGVWSLLRQP